MAQVCGINVQRIHLIAFGIASALAAAGGSLVAVMVAIQPEMGQVYTFKSFLVIVLGGAGNYPGALLGGLLLGLVEQLSSLFLTTQVNEAVAYVLLVRRAPGPADRPAEGARVVKRWFSRRSLAVLVLGLAALPDARPPGYGIRVMLQLFMWIALAQSWNLISGLTGYVSFGHVAFFGMGAYTAGILDRQGGLAVAARLPGRRRDGHGARARSSAGRASGSRARTSPSPCSGSTRCCAWWSRTSRA